MDSILKYFPQKLQKEIKQNIEKNFNVLEEIRIRVSKPIVLKFNNFERIIEYCVTQQEMIGCLQLICENSIYSYQKHIAEGFVTIKGGHRVGITGSCVVENGRVVHINYICSLNFRIARQVIGCSNKILKYIVNIEKNTVYNTLIVSAPGAGKTTLLRDIIRQVAGGIKEINFEPINVGVVDERGEIAALYKGIPQNNIGIKTDVIENVSKSIGMKMLIRSMAPKVIVADEVGGYEDIDAINYVVCSGSKGIFTAHGSNFEEISLNPVLKNLIRTNMFERIFFLDETNKGNIKKMYGMNKRKEEYEEMVF